MDLLDRLRHNRLQRLRRIPFYLVGSENRIAEIAGEAEKIGVTGFILDGMGKSEILAMLQPHKAGLQAPLDPPRKQPASTPASVPASAPASTPAATRGGANFRDAGLLSRTLLEAGIERTFSGQGGHGAILLFGVDAYGALEDGVGKAAASRIAEKIARLIQGKLGGSDFIGHYRPGCFAIVTRSSRLEQCAAFAGRVIKSVAAARIAVQGRQVSLSISSGAASRPEDGNVSGEALLGLALARMEQAMAEGGGRVVVHGEGEALGKARQPRGS
ncbi:MAG: diguanylate cyclase [Azovibrio sp.]|uniref:GGDEF domain-containing protein n=1 Tax=Azovibrio sp. TaxID=1872673 RepID=UPI003C72C2D9